MTARKNGAQKNATTKKKGGPGRPFKPGNPWAIKKGEVRNPGGRPKLVSGAYREWLEFEDDKGVTNAAKVAFAMGVKAVEGDTSAAREIRQTTEGDKLTFDITRLTDEQLARVASGEDIRAVLANPGDGGIGTPPASEESEH